MDKFSHVQQSVWWNYLSITKLQRLHCWSLGMDKYFHHKLCKRCYYLSMLGFKSSRVSKNDIPVRTYGIGKLHSWSFVRAVHRSSMDSHQNESVMPSCGDFCVVILEKVLSKKVSDRWFETPWNTCDVIVMSERQPRRLMDKLRPIPRTTPKKLVNEPTFLTTSWIHEPGRSRWEPADRGQCVWWWQLWTATYRESFDCYTVLFRWHLGCQWSMADGTWLAGHGLSVFCGRLV